MKDTIKNSIIGGFAVFGFLCLFTAQVNPIEGYIYADSDEPKSTEVQEIKHVWSIHTTPDSKRAFKLNRETGEVWVYYGNTYSKTQPDY